MNFVGALVGAGVGCALVGNPVGAVVGDLFGAVVGNLVGAVVDNLVVALLGGLQVRLVRWNGADFVSSLTCFAIT